MCMYGNERESAIYAEEYSKYLVLYDNYSRDRDVVREIARGLAREATERRVRLMQYSPHKE